MKTSDTVFLEKYTSHFIERVRKGYSMFNCERELETKQNCNKLTPTLKAISVSFPFSWCCSTGGPGALSAGCCSLYRILSLTHLISYQLKLLVPSYIIVLRPFNLFSWLARPEYATSGVFGLACLIIIKRK